jgi:hypothetical protein
MARAQGDTPFAATLTDRQVSDVQAYVRARYGDRAPWPRLEADPSSDPWLDARLLDVR